jgi:hypothetical protein
MVTGDANLQRGLFAVSRRDASDLLRWFGNVFGLYIRMLLYLSFDSCSTIPEAEQITVES